MLRVLIIDDNEAVCTALRVLFELHDIKTVTALSPEEGLALAQGETFGLVIQDMNFTEDSTSGEEGVRLFRALRVLDPYMPILLITAWTSLERAVQLVKEGAHDYIGKPWDDVKLVKEVKNLLRLRSQQPAGPEDGGFGEADLCGMVFADPIMRRLIATAVQVAHADVPVLITGPNGSGKELLAHIIQANSGRRNRPFVKVNAGGLPNELLESELFGSEAGAFTGAQKRRIGRFEEAHGGTLFLDEIGNLPLQGQIKLLRVLQSGEFSRLGSNKVLSADVRIISATNTDLGEAIGRGVFREDLYFRLNVVELAMPPLAGRRADILPLARHFLERFQGNSPKMLSAEAEDALLNHAWSGNVRELRNLIQRATLISTHPTIYPEDLSLRDSAVAAPAASWHHPERERVEQALLEAEGNISKAAAALGISRQALYRRMDKHGIVWERRPQT